MRIVTQQRGAMRACDECGYWPKRLIEVGLARSPMVAMLCPSCAGKLIKELDDYAPWAQGGKCNAMGD
ncbi:MAG TPA: hypothetical protein PK728_05505 [Bacillota bacterium]|nr:hypothetical protein [Bacillota bacterium]